MNNIIKTYVTQGCRDDSLSSDSPSPPDDSLSSDSPSPPDDSLSSDSPSPPITPTVTGTRGRGRGGTTRGRGRGGTTRGRGHGGTTRGRGRGGTTRGRGRGRGRGTTDGTHRQFSSTSNWNMGRG